MRKPSAIPRSHERLRVVKADVMEPHPDGALEGQDVAITSVSVSSGLRERGASPRFSSPKARET